MQVNLLSNANVFIDGGPLLGECSEIELPNVTQVMSEHVFLGGLGKFELPTGVDKMSATFKFNAFYPNTAAKIANPDNVYNVQVRSSLATFEGSGKVGSQACKVALRGSFTQFPLGMYKQQEAVELETTMNVTYIKLTIGTRVILELDVMSNLYKVDGVDITAQYRQDLGML